MKRFLTVAVAVAAVCLMALPAFAQAKKDAGGKGKDAPKGEPVQKNYDFDGDIVEAQFLRPDQGVAEVVRLDEGPSLIKVRSDFVDEILKSAEDL